MAVMTPPPSNFQEPIRSALAEALSLSYADILPQVLNLRVTLDAAKLSDFDEYRIDGGYHFIAWEVRPHVAMNSLSTEVAAGGAGSLGLIGGVQQRQLLKALNAQVELFNPDREAMRYIETDVQNSAGDLSTALRMSDLMSMAGGGSILFASANDIMPLLVMEGDRIRMKVTLADSAAAVVGQQTEYGLSLIGAFVRARTT